MAHIAEIAPDVFRISVHVSEGDMQFNHFLVRDDEPLLFHLGSRAMYDELESAIAKLIDPGTLRWLSFSHFEADESGALHRWLERAPNARPFCTPLAADLNVNDVSPRPALVLGEGETLSTGKYRYRMLATPHLPHNWDAGMLFEETGRTLFCSDLLFQLGNPPALATDILDPVRSALVAMKGSLFDFSVPYTPETDRRLHELAALDPVTLAVMHGSSFRSERAGEGTALLGEAAAIYREALGAP